MVASLPYNKVGKHLDKDESGRSNVSRPLYTLLRLAVLRSLSFFGTVL